MAGIAGVFCADGRPAEIAEVERMAAAVADRGPDGVSFWHSGPVAFAHLQFCSTPEAVDERQPLVSPSGEACLVWNGRLDNREELIAALAAKGEHPADKTDPGLVLSAYLLWGTDCVQRLVGDFALALWDARSRQLWCARDYIGIRPFYYYWDGKTFLFAPEIRALLAHPLVSLRLNEGMVGEFIEGPLTSRDETLYEDIRRLPSGSSLVTDSSGDFRITSWWNPDLSLLQYRTDEDYAEHFRHLIDQSVLSKMRCNAAWGVELSGGLDSSTIAVTARALLDRGGPDQSVLTFSLAWPGKPWDESEDIAAVVEKANLAPELVRPLKPDLDFFRARAAHWRDYPGNPNGEPMSFPTGEAARQRGTRVLLNGIGGDEWLQGSSLHIVDLAAKAQFGRLLRLARANWQAYGRYAHWSIDLARQLASGAAPVWMHARRRKRRFERETILSPDFLRRTQLADRLCAPSGRESHRFAARAQEAIFRFAVGGTEAHVFEWNDREAAHAAIERRYPFFDRRLAEFCLRIPEEQRRRGTVTKYVLRTAMRDRLPERVRLKSFKADFSELYETVLYDPAAGNRLKNLTMLTRTDWLDPRRFASHMNLPEKPDMESSWLYGSVWMTLGVDLWLENVLNSG
jgi:asparagine synthase (glutamine-hydrolysing)